MAAATANQTSILYRSVIEEVIKNVRDAFINEGHDEKVIQELKNAWELRLKDSEAVKMSKNDLSIPDTSAAIYPYNTIQKSLPSQHLSMPMPSGSLVGNFQSGGDHRVREIQSQPGYPMKQHATLPQASLHSMPPHYPAPFAPPHQMYPNRSMPAFPPRMEKLDSTLPSPDDKPSKEQLPSFKYDGKRQQSELAMLEKIPNAKRSRMGQLDGNGGGGTAGATGGADVIEDSTDDDDDDDLDEDDDRTDNSDLGPEDTAARVPRGAQGATGGADETGKEGEGGEGDEELGSTDDDETGDDQEDHFETDNMVVCQFKKVTRTRNKWRFHLKDGIMNLNGMDFVFAQATGEADW